MRHLMRVVVATPLRNLPDAQKVEGSDPRAYTGRPDPPARSVTRIGMYDATRPLTAQAASIVTFTSDWNTRLIGLDAERQGRSVVHSCETGDDKVLVPCQTFVLGQLLRERLQHPMEPLAPLLDTLDVL